MNTTNVIKTNEAVPQNGGYNPEYIPDPMDEWALMNDCLSVSETLYWANGQKRTIYHEIHPSVIDGSGEYVISHLKNGHHDLLQLILMKAFERASELLIWGDVTILCNTAEMPIGVARNVKEAMQIILSHKETVTGWELL